MAKADLLVAEGGAKSAQRAAGQRRRVYRSLYNEGWLLHRAGQIDDAVAINSEMPGLNEERRMTGINPANVPTNSSLAYVVVQHLAPTHKAMLAELRRS